MAITDKQQRFIEEMAHPDTTQKQAAIRAGYSIDSASSTASYLMSKPEIRNAIAETREEMGLRLGITPERILQELALIGFSNVDNYTTTNEETGEKEIDFSKVHGDAGRAFTIEIETSTSGKEKVKKTKAKMLDKADALLKMGKHIGMFQEKVEHTVELSLSELIAQSYKKDKNEIVVDYQEEPEEIEGPVQGSISAIPSEEVSS